MGQFILSIDQGTTSSRALLLDQQAQIVTKAQKEFPQYFPQNGWVEHNSEEIWETTLTVCKQVIEDSKINPSSIAAIGITNQRETTVVWDRQTGNPIYPAIVWQDRRTATFCEALKKENPQLEKKIANKTGLLLDPYFSATKIAWILDHVEGARQKAEQGRLAFGTIDSFLLYRLTGGKSHATDVTNASRTMLLNLETLEWDEELLALFKIPKSLLPEVKENCADFGVSEASLLGAEIPIAGMAGDQHAASFGQACFEPGMVKSTYGTGCFMLVNTGGDIVHSRNRLLTTVLFKVNGRTTYAVEGSIFVAGAAVKWLHEYLGLIRAPRETEAIAASVDSTDGLYVVPAFTGLGAPYWKPEARGAILGMTRNTGRAEIVRGVLEAVCYQSKDLLTAILNDGVHQLKQLRVDGGMVENSWLLQFLADILGVAVERPVCIETTAMGAAYLAGLQVGVFQSLEEIEALRKSDKVFVPQMLSSQREALYKGWKNAVAEIS
jgi:glycerol kinase